MSDVIEMACGVCKNKLGVRQRAVPTTVQCPHCQAVLQVAAVAPIASQPIPVASLLPDAPIRNSRLARCPDCSREVSLNAKFCPGCGCSFEEDDFDFKDDDDRPGNRSRVVQTIELTGKGWKAQMLLAALMTIIGMILIFAGSGVIDVHQRPDIRGGNAALSGFGGFILVVGLIWFVLARIGAWWDHG